MLMKTLKRIALSGFIISALLAPSLFALSISQLRLQERHFALADFKHIYKQRQHFNLVQAKRLKRQRIKNVSRTSLCNQGAQRGSGKYSHKYATSQGVSSSSSSSSNGTYDNTDKPSRHYQNNPWAKR